MYATTTPTQESKYTTLSARDIRKVKRGITYILNNVVKKDIASHTVTNFCDCLGDTQKDNEKFNLAYEILALNGRK